MAAKKRAIDHQIDTPETNNNPKDSPTQSKSMTNPIGLFSAIS